MANDAGAAMADISSDPVEENPTEPPLTEVQNTDAANGSPTTEPAEDLVQDVKNAEEEPNEETLHVARSKLFLEELDKRCRQEGVEAVVITIIDPKLRNPIVYTLGDKVQITVVACDLARLLKRKMITSEEFTV
jgi:hypothetical protein